MKLLILLILMSTACLGFSQTDTTFWENGEVKKISKCDLDTCRYYNFYETSQLKLLEISVKDQGLIWKEEYCENGQVKIKYNPTSEDLNFITEYLCNGKISMEYYKSRYGYRGIFKVFHPNGEVAEQGKYEKSKSPIGEQRVGRWVSYYPDGKIFYEAFYENGDLIKEKKY